MLVKIVGELPYSDKTLVVDLEADVSGATALVGPNLTGKSLMLQCLYAMAGQRIGRPIRPPQGLRCEVETTDYTGIYVDAYRVVAQLYEVAAQESLGRMMEDAEVLTNAKDEDIKRLGEDLRIATRKIRSVLGDLHFVLNAKQRADDFLVSEAVGLLNELYAEWAKKAEEARAEFRDIFDDFFPLVLSATADGFVWTDKKADTAGRGLRQLSTAFSPALVALYAVYAYAIPDTVYLLVEEPEVHAHPLMAYFLGAYLRRLVEKSRITPSRRGRLNIVVSTHSFDFLRGFWDEGVKVYVLKRFNEDGKVLLKVAEQWQGEGYVPGFSDTAIYKLLGLR